MFALLPSERPIIITVRAARPTQRTENTLLHRVGFSPRTKSVFDAYSAAFSNAFPIFPIRFSFHGERVFDRKAASSTIGAHICLFRMAC